MKCNAMLAGLMVALMALSAGCTGNGEDDKGDVTTTDQKGGDAEVTAGCLSAEECDDGDLCTDDECVEGECVSTAKECDDGLFCNGTESCVAESGECLSADAPELDDGVACTVDECDEEADEVTHEPDDAGCDDGDPCTDDYTCAEGTCVGTAKECDDGLWCNGEESCDAETGDCLDGEAPVVDDGVDCTVDSCDEDNDVVVNASDDAFCDDDNFCTDDVCDPVDGCSHSNSTKECDDGLACTENDVCADGVCAGFSKECDDGLYCNGLEACSDETGECLEGTAPMVDDGVDCTVDSCDEENNIVLHEADHDFCDDGNPCTNDVCVAETGCVNLNNTEPCDDGVPCTIEDVCADGVCAGTEKVCDDGLFCNGLETCEAETGDCLEGTPPVVDDEVDCTDDSCDEENDVVVNAPNDGLCDDQNPCTDDVCDPVEGCLNTNNTLECDDGDPCTIDDVCGEGLCAGVAKVCDDGLWCNGLETCEAETGDCLDGTPPVVDDEVDCTDDSCDEENDVVVNAPNDGFCDDQNPCTDDVCDPVEGCLNTNNTLPCDDGDACTLEDTCAEGACVGTPKTCDNGLFCDGEEGCDSVTGDCTPGTPPVTDDTFACTADACDEENDVVTHTPDDGLCNDDNLCTDDSCSVETGCVFAPNTVPCDDNEACTEGDTCGDGSCQPGAWVCEDCTNDIDDNNDGDTDCCDALCADDDSCQVEALCGNQDDDDCDGVPDCEDLDCLGSDDCGPYPVEGDLIITEIMQNPTAVGDAEGEWIEIYNASDLTFDLRFLEVTDAGVDKFVILASLPIEPGAFLVFARNGDIQANGGVNADYVWENFSLGNSDDEVILTLNGVMVDTVAYDGGPLFPDPAGASMQLDPAHFSATDNDVGEYWCKAVVPIAEGDPMDLGTPGAANPPCHETDCEDLQDNDLDGDVDCYDIDCAEIPGCGDGDQDGVFDRDDICPIADDAVDEDQDNIPDGCEIDWAGNVWQNSGATFDIGSPFNVYLQVYMAGVTEEAGAAEGIVATLRYKAVDEDQWTEVPMTYNGEMGSNDELVGAIPANMIIPGYTVDVEFALSYVTSNDLEYVYEGDVIKDQNGTEVPLTYTATGKAPAPQPGDVVITEILQNPTAVDDAFGEWFEVYVAATHLVDFEGVDIYDVDNDAHTIQVSVVGKPGMYVLFGNNYDFGSNGGVALDYAYESIVLGNSTDELYLASGGQVLDAVIWNNGMTFPDPDGASMSLDPDFMNTTDNDAGENWCTAVDQYGAGDLGTPGSANPQCP
jgi:hypothetical protein